MTVEAKMYDIMRGAVGVTALVPAARLKPQGDWQNLALPNVVHFPVAVETIHTHNEGLMALRLCRFYQISVFALTYGEAASIRDALVVALDGYKDADVNRIAYRGVGSSDFDTDRKIQHIALNFEVDGALTC